jgi:hypothetical protein
MRCSPLRSVKLSCAVNQGGQTFSRHTFFFFLCSAGDRTWGLMCTRLALTTEPHPALHFL